VNRRAKAYLAGLGALVAILAFSWWFLDGSKMRPRILRSRLMLVVETPEGERSGASVTQVTTYFPGGLTKAQGYAILDKLVGDAAVVDLGARGLLFATFESEWALRNGGGSSGYNAALDPFPQEKFRGSYPNDASTGEKYAAYIDEVNRLKPKGALPFKDLPVLARFRDASDPTSVELVDPLDLAASFGPGDAQIGICRNHRRPGHQRYSSQTTVAGVERGFAFSISSTRPKIGSSYGIRNASCRRSPI
jgi:hypothetical protein